MDEESEPYLNLSLKLGSAMIASGHLKGAKVVLKKLVITAGNHGRIAERAGAKLAGLTS